MYKLIFEQFLQQFIKAVGRRPQTTKELMSIQDDVVRYINKTKGVPGKKSTPPSSPFQGFKPTVIQGGKSKEGITSIPVNKQIQDLKTFEREVIDELNAPIKPDLKVVPKFSKKDRILQIDDELEKLVAKEGKYGKMNRNDREDLMIKLQDESSTLQDKTLFKDSPEAIAKIKADNKAAVERLKKKKTVEDFSDDGDFDPGGMASGGIAGQLHLNEGGRVPMIFGGSAGLKAMIQTIKAALNKGRKTKVKTLFPKYSVEEKELLKLGEKYLPRDSATLAAKETAGKAEGVQVLIDRLKFDKKILKKMEENKAMNDPGLDFMMRHLEDTMYPSHLKKYTNIDKDVLQMETIKKNLLMKDRKLNAEGGRVSLSKGGLANILGV